MAKKVFIQVLADTISAIANIDKVTGALGKMGSAGKNAGGKMQAFGRDVGAVTTVPIAAALGTATKAALDFDTQIGDASRALDLSGKKLDDFRGKVLDTSADLGMMPTKFAEIATEAGKLGIASNQILDFSTLVSEGVMATGANSIELAQTLAALKTITGDSANEMRLLVAAANKVDDSIGGATPAILEFVRQTAAAGKLVNIGTKELAAYGGTMQSVGIANGVAYRTMGKLITTLAAPQILGKTKTNAMADLGISATEMAARMKASGSGGIQFFLTKVKELAESDPQKALGAVQQLIGADFGDEVLTAALAVDKLGNALKFAGDDAGNLAKFQGEVEKKMAGSAGQIQIFKANLARVGIIVGESILPALNQLLSATIPVVEGFARFAQANPMIVQTGVVIAGLVAIIAPLSMVIGAVTTAVGAVMSAAAVAFPVIMTIIGVIISVPGLTVAAIVAAAAGIAAGVYAIYRHWDWLKAQTVSIWNQILDFADRATTWLVQKLKDAGSGMMNALAQGISSAASGPFNVINDVMERVRAYLPGSDAKTGPLSDLTKSGAALPQTFAQGMSNSPAIQAANNFAASVLPQPAPLMVGGGGGGGSTTTINFQPTINLNGTATEDDGRRILKQLEAWATELNGILDRNKNRNNRR